MATAAAFLKETESQEQGNDHYRAGPTTCGSPHRMEPTQGPRVEGPAIHLWGYICPGRGADNFLTLIKHLFKDTVALPGQKEF